MSTPQERVDEVTAKARNSVAGVKDALVKVQAEISRALPQQVGIVAEQFTRVLLTTVQTSPAIARCSRESIVFAALESAALGLPIDGVLGHAYLLPFKGKAQLLIGYRGFCELAYRSGMIVRLAACEVCEADLFTYMEGTEPRIEHRKELKEDRGRWYAAFALAHPKAYGAPPIFVVLRRDEIEARRDRSASYRNNPKATPWHTDELAMVRKTAIRALAPLLPQSPILQRAAAADELREFGIRPFAPLSEHRPEVIDIEPEVDEDAPLPEGAAEAFAGKGD